MSDDRTIDPAEEPVQPEREVAAELRLRPEGPRVVRLSRKVLGLLAGVAAVALGGALIFALQSSRPQVTAELFNTDNPNQAEGLTRLPGDYAAVPRQVPQLGPPLPGDLGRPMLNAGVQPTSAETFAGAPPPSQPDPAVQRREQERQRQEQERQRRTQELDDARSSRLFAAETSAGPAKPAPVPSAPIGASIALAPVEASSGPSTAGNRQLAFLNGPADRRTLSSDRLQAAPSRYVVQTGSIIAAALITGIRSDLPGQVTAQVTENVYDSPTGRALLVPQGARLIGEYDAQLGFGQSRALLVWTRLILPDGRSVVLERQPAADALGQAGLQGRVDRHWGEMFRAAAVSTLLGVGTELAAGDDEDRLVRALRRGAQDSMKDAGEQLVRRSLDVEPTLTIRPGYPVRVILTRDLVLEPWTG